MKRRYGVLQYLAQSRFKQYEVDNIHTLDIYIFQFMAATLEQDLIISQTKIITLLTEYQKTSEEIIKSNYMNDLLTLLNSIASFDHQKIKQCQNIIKDKTALEYLDNIADKIRNAQQNKIKQDVAEPTTIVKPKSIEKFDKSEEKQKKSKKQGGLFDFVKRKFSMKQKKATEMILPDEEPKCYYDPVTKSYVFQGEEPQAPKEIQRPPSTSERKAKQETKKKQDDSELGQLTAPPAFKRKSTAAGKGKIKIKEQVQVVRIINEPLSFARVIQEVNLTYNELFEKVKIGIYQSHSCINYSDSDRTHEFTKFIQRSIEFSQQINLYESKNLEKWTKILTSESRELKIMEKVLREMSESANIYSTLITKLDHSKIQYKNIQQEENLMKLGDTIKVNQLMQTDALPAEARQVLIVKEAAQDQEQRQRISNMENELKSIKHQNSYLKAQNQQLQVIKRQLEQENQRIQRIVQQQRSKNNEFVDTNIDLKRLMDNYRQETRRQSQTIRQREQFYLLQANRLNHEITKIAYDHNNKITELQTIRSKLQNEKIKLKAELKDQRSKHTESHDFINAEMQRQKIKIEEHLRFTQQRQMNYLKVLQDMQQHESTIQEYDTIDQQNGLLRSIMKKRLEANKNPEIEHNHQSKIQRDASNSMISQLSDIVGAVAQTNLDRLEQFSKGYQKLLQKYIETKTLLNKIKNNSTNESICLNRSITKIKGLFEICKIGKQEAQQKCSQLELECDRLKKKLNHYKQQDSFNKSYITRLKPSKINNQDESILSLHEQKEQLTTQIDDLHKEIEVKNETLKKNQIDLQDLLINYEKNQDKLLEIEAKYKEGQRQRKQHRQSKEKLQNKIKLLELKLKNQRQRYDQIQNQQQSRLKSMQTSYEKKLKLLKIQLDQSYQREVQIKIQHEQIIKEFRTRLNLLQQSHHKIENELRDAIKLKSNENSQLLSMIQDVNQRLEIQRQQKLGLNERNLHLMQTETQLNRKLNEIIDEHLKQISIHRDSQQNMNNIIATLLEKYNSFKLEQQQFKENYQSKLCILQKQLEISQLQSNDLLNQINLYSSHIINLNSVIQDISKSHIKEKQTHQIAYNQITIRSQKMQQQGDYWKAQCNQKSKQNKEFEQLIQKMSQDMARLSSDRECLGRDKTDLQEKLMFKDRQMETLNNEVNKIHQDLLVKTQQLQEKDKIMLQHQEQAVMKREELDELKNQLLKLQQEIEGHIKQFNQQKAQKEEAVLQSKRIIAEKQDEIKDLNRKIQHSETVLSDKSDQATIVRQAQQISLLDEKNQQLLQQQDKQIAEFESQKSLIQSLQSERQTMKSQIQQLQSNLNELILKLTQKEVYIEKSSKILQQQPIQNTQDIPGNEEIQKEIEYLYNEIYQKDIQIDNLKKQLKEKQMECTEAVHEKSWLLSALGSQKEINQSKDKQIAQLKNVVKDLEQVNQAEIDEKLKLAGEIRRLTQSNRFLQLDLLSVTAKKRELQSIKKQLNRRIQELSKRRFLEHESFVQRQAVAETQIKEENLMIDSLLKDIRAKDQMIIEKQREIVTEQKLISELECEKKMKQDEMQNMCGILQEKDKVIEQLKRSQQQKCIIIGQKENEIIDLNKNLTEITQIIEKQQAQLEKIKHQDLSQIQMDEIKQLRLKLQMFEHEKNEILKKLDEFNEKQMEYTKKIANLEQKSSQVLISGDYQELQQKYKTLLDENTSLMNEKVELMKSNNYLVSINQKLVGEKSSSNMRELHKTQSHIHPPNTNKVSEVKQRPTSEIIESKPENKGFFGALSSLFLTPTQADKLRK